MKFIALRSLHQKGLPDANALGESRFDAETDGGRNVDGGEDQGLRYVNPSLVVPLQEMWVVKGRGNGENGENAEV